MSLIQLSTLNPQRWLRNATCFTNKTRHSLDKTLLQSFFALKLSDKVLIVAAYAPKGGSKMQFCDLVYKAGRYRKRS